MDLLILSLLLLGNVWIWKIASFNLLLGLLVLTCSVILYFSLTKGSNILKKVFLILFALVVFFQWKTTDVNSLTGLTNDQRRVQDMRLSEYPPLEVPIGYWLEGRKEALAFWRIRKNMFELLDPNLYFFANHPRERVGYDEFEKFPYILFPFFVLGLFMLVKKPPKSILLVSLSLAVILISLIGHNNEAGPFSMFPFMFSAIIFGVDEFRSRYKFSVIYLIIFALVFVQTVIYAIH
jgi:hypothetical protein